MTTYGYNHSEGGFGGGLDYEYRINQWLGIGGFAEYAGGDFEHVLIGLPLSIHPYKGWRLVVAPATEIHKEHGEDGGGGENKGNGGSRRPWLYVSAPRIIYHRAGVLCRFFRA